MVPDWFGYVILTYQVIWYLNFLIPALLVWWFVKNRRVKIVLIPIFVLLFSIITLPRLLPVYVIQGKVVDAVTGDPVKYAIVQCNIMTPLKGRTTKVVHTGETGEYRVKTNMTHVDILVYHPRYARVQKGLQGGYSREWKYARRIVPFDIKLNGYLNSLKDPQQPQQWNDIGGILHNFQEYLVLAAKAGIADKIQYQELPAEWHQLAVMMENNSKVTPDEFHKKDVLARISCFEALISSGTMVQYALDPQGSPVQVSQYYR